MKSSKRYNRNNKYDKTSSEILGDFIFKLIFGLLLFFICLYIYKIYDSCDFLKDMVEKVREYEDNRRCEKMTEIIKKMEEKLKNKK